jgi:hypothetical protein
VSQQQPKNQYQRLHAGRKYRATDAIGDRLEKLAIRDEARTAQVLNEHPDLEVPACPKCAKKHMVIRVGPKGRFWGCPNYPACRGTRNMT